VPVTQPVHVSSLSSLPLQHHMPVKSQLSFGTEINLYHVSHETTHNLVQAHAGVTSDLGSDCIALILDTCMIDDCPGTM